MRKVVSGGDPGYWLELSCTSLSFPVLNLDQVAQLMGILGFRYLDVCIAEGNRDVRAASVWESPEDLARSHRALLDRSRLVPADVFAHIGRSALDRPVNTADPDWRKENRRRLHSYFIYAAGIGSPGVTISPGQEGDEAAFQRACEELTWASQTAKDCGVVLSVEAHLNSVADTVGRTLSLCQAVPGLRLTVDYSHFLASGVAQSAIDPLLRHARHVHVRQSRPGQLQCPVHAGALDVQGMLSAASAAGYSGRYSVEFVHSTAWKMNSVDVLTETVQMRNAILEAAPSINSQGSESGSTGNPTDV